MKISYQITREDFIEAQKLHRSKSPRAFVRAIVLQHQFTADISEDGVHLESPDFDANLKWGLYLRFLESDRVFLLYQTNRMFNLFPKAAFAKGEVDEFRQLARRKLPDK